MFGSNMRRHPLLPAMHASAKVPKVVVALRVRIGKGMETTMLFREAFEFVILSGTS
jgi:hypothetical protein